MKNLVEIYHLPNGDSAIEVHFKDDSVWLNRVQLAELFNRDVKTIGKHVNNVFRDGELTKTAVVANFSTTAVDGKTYKTDHYNLDVIISVGYRVKSPQGVQFRQWATRTLKQHRLEGYTLNKSFYFVKNELISLNIMQIHRSFCC